MKKIIRLTESDLTKIVERVIEEQSWSEYLTKVINYSSPLTAVLNTNTGKQALNVLISSSPIGVIKNMSLAAAKGDAKSFQQAFELAEKRAGTDVSDLKNAAFKDMKSFGELLLSMGIN